MSVIAHKVQTGFGETYTVQASESKPGCVLLQLGDEAPVLLTAHFARRLSAAITEALDESNGFAAHGIGGR